MGKSKSIHRVDAIFYDAVVTFVEVSDNREIWNCKELQFVISAIPDNGTRTGHGLPTFTIVGGYLPGIYSSLQ